MPLVEEIDRLSSHFPSSERFGLVAQLRRAAVSVPSNIAEGHGRRSRRDFLRFVVVALGPLAELETQLLIAVRLGIVTPQQSGYAFGLVDRTGRILRGLERSLSFRPKSGADA